MSKTIEVPKALLQLYRVMSDREDTPINCLYLSKRYAISTNGHHVVRVEHKLDDLIDLEDPIYIPKQVLIDVLRGSNKHCIFEVTVQSPTSAILKRRDLRNGTQVSSECFDYGWYNYPDIDSVIPKPNDSELSSIGLSLKLLAEFYSFLKATKAPYNGLFNLTDSLSPIRSDIETDFGLVTYVLSPVRTS